ncbi:MAG TPA: hypothetical protein VK668_07795 [Mucilaginibacter sp.]|nr:hypothetical protein [Mucilaginibacter sp.]
MDSSYRKLLIWTLVSSLLVIVGMGHGIAPIAMTEVLMFKNLDFRFSFKTAPEAVVMTSSLIFLVGQIFLLMYIIRKKSVLLWVSLLILWFGMFVLIRGEGGAMLVFGLPFVILSIFVFVISIRELRIVNENDE